MLLNSRFVPRTTGFNNALRQFCCLGRSGFQRKKMTVGHQSVAAVWFGKHCVDTTIELDHGCLQSVGGTPDMQCAGNADHQALAIG